MSEIALSNSELGRLVHEAHQRRVDAGLGDETNAYRLIHDAYDGLPRLRIDRLSDFAVIKYRHPHWTTERSAMALISALRDVGLKGAVFLYDAPSKDSTEASDARDLALNSWLEEIAFRAPTETILGRESGFTFALSAVAGFSSGLFFDMRSVRESLSKRWAGRRVLNLFAYTCAFGAVLGADAEVTNVDVSKTYLDWGKRNYALNNVTTRDEDFVRKDAFEYLEIAKKKQNLFDAVVLDPPSYSAGKKGRSRRFSLKNDFPELVALALDALAPRGELFVSTNYEGLSRQRFEALALGVARPRGKRIVERWGPGPDFPVPEEDYHLKTGLIR